MISFSYILDSNIDRFFKFSSSDRNKDSDFIFFNFDDYIFHNSI